MDLLVLGWLREKSSNISIPLAKDNLPALVNNFTSNSINEFERKISGKGAFRAEKGFTLFISYEDMSDINKINKLLEDYYQIIKSFGCINWCSYWNSKS